MKKYLSLFITLGVFFALVLLSEDAANGARQGLSVCAATLVPSLFPFFVLANLLSALGLPDILGRKLSGVMKRVFHVSGSGAQAFFIGISGGYPLGASVVAELRRAGHIAKSEAERLLAFCNNSGPAFILGAVGGVFHSPAAGLLLYGTHILAALCVGLLFRGSEAELPAQSQPLAAPPQSFSRAFSGAVAKAAASMLAVAGYVVLFSALLALTKLPSLLPPAAGALFSGFFELGSGIAAMNGLPLTPGTLSCAAFLLGWGGISVHCQTLGLLADTDIKCARHLAGRALCGVIAAALTFVVSMLVL